jgi:two-component system chemotaxis response regulator CheB
MIKVLIVEDSPVLQELLSFILKTDPGINIIGKAKDGEEAIDFVNKHKPDVITMDIHMPLLNGIEATRRIMQTMPVPIIIVSSTIDTTENSNSFKAMEAGALALLPKPVAFGHPDFASSAKELITTVKLMSEIKVVKRWANKLVKNTDPINHNYRAGPTGQPKLVNGDFQMVAIGASTGGPMVIKTILSNLKPGFPLPVLIVQHIACGFLQGFADWLGDAIALPLHVAKHQDLILPGHVYIAPDLMHLGVDINNHIILSNEDPVNGVRPSVGKLFRSVLEVYGRGAIGVLLTGMGKDGAEEMKRLHDHGAVTIAQDEESSVVHGMPGSAIALKGVSYVLSPNKIPEMLNKLTDEKK